MLAVRSSAGESTEPVEAVLVDSLVQLLSISQLLPSIVAKARNQTESIRSAPAIAAGIVGAAILQVLFSQWSFINNIFTTAPLNLSQWLICLGAGLPIIAMVAERTAFGIAASVNRFDPPN